MVDLERSDVWSIVRLTAAEVACAFRVVSHEVVGVIAGLMYIMAIEHKRVFNKTKRIADA